MASLQTIGRIDYMNQNCDKRANGQTTPRDDQIVKLSQSGLSAMKIRGRLNLEITSRSVQRVIQKRLGKVARTRNRQVYALENLRPIVVECLSRLGKDPFVCDVCEASQPKKCDIHHTKYDGATIYDLQYVCRSCNLARAGQGLS